MKKTTPIVAIALLAALSMSSCKKKYSCHCVSTVNGAVTLDVTVDYDKKSTKKDAQKECDLGDSEVTSGGNTEKTECSLK